MTHTSSDRPLLTRFATERVHGEPTPGRYCQVRRQWLVEVDGEERPLTEVAGALAELNTKTKVTQETDDTDLAGALVGTKTFVQTEEDDPGRWASAILEITTKTEVRPEQDKQDLDAFGALLLEGSTKTAVDVERDDVGRLGDILSPTASLNS